MLEQVELTLERSEFALDPEGASVSAVVTVRNNRPIIDEFRLHVEGLDASASTVAPDVVRLFPHTETTALLTVSAEPGALAGTRYFRVVASSSRDPSVEGAIDAMLNIGTVGHLELELSPQRLRGRSRASARIVVRNQKNVHSPVRLLATDPAALLRFDTDRVDFVLGPRAEANVRLRVRPPRPGLTGPSREYEFSVSVLSSEAPLSPPLAGMSGTFVQLPFAAWLAGLAALIASWLTPLVMLFVLLAVGVWYLGAPGQPAPPHAAVAIDAASNNATPGEATAASGDQVGDQASGQEASSPAPPSPGGALAVAAAANQAGQPQQATATGPVPQAAVAPTAVPTAAPPVIARFGLSQASGEPSPVVPLDWSVRGASSVSVSQSPPSSAASGQYGEVERRDYNLTASNSAGQTTQSLSVYVLRPPSIDEFSADRTAVEPGQSVYLLWRTARAQRVFLDESPLAPAEAGSLTLQVSEPHTFTLRAENSAGEVQQSVTISVTQPTATPAPTPVPTRVVPRT